MAEKLNDKTAKEVLRYISMNKYTLREVAELTGASRSFVHRIKQRNERKAIYMSPLRRKFGEEPLPVGMGFNMMSSEWRQQNSV